MATTDYFIQDSLVLDWIWERVKVDLEDTHIDIMVMTAMTAVTDGYIH